MSITLPPGLPAAEVLKAEGIEVAAATTPDSRPLQIALMNLMPEKPATEVQLARVLGATPFAVELTLFVPDGYVSKNTAPEHMAAHYRTWSEIRHRRFDGLIVTGAPIETLEYEEVVYWQEMTRILDWSQSHARSCYFICWAAQAALYHFHGVPKYTLEKKMFGVFPHRVTAPDHPLMRGFGDGFRVPVSRHSEVRAEDLPTTGGVAVLAKSEESGLCLVEDRKRNAIYMFNHFEYDAESLAREYRRDRAAGKPIAPPRHYFPDDDPAQTPENTWRAHAETFFPNWLAGLQRRARRGPAEQRMMNWLLTAPTEGPEADFLVRADDTAETTTRVLRRLAMLGLRPEGLKASKSDTTEVVIELSLATVGETQAGRVAQALLCLEEVRKVSYRGAGGLGGTFVARPTRGMVAAPHMEPPGKYPGAESRVSA